MFEAQIFSAAPYSQTTSAYVPPSTWVTKFHTHKKQTGKTLNVSILIFIFLDNKLEDKDPACNDNNHALNSVCY